MQSLFSTAFILICVGSLFSYLHKKSKTAPQIIDGAIVLRFSAVFEILGWIGLSLISIISIGGILDSKTGIGDLIFGFFFLIFASISVYLILARRNFCISLTTEGINYKGVLGGNKFIQWKNIKQVSFKPSAKSLTITDGVQNISTSTLIIGFYTLLERLQAHLDPAILGTSIQDIERFKAARGF